MSINKLTGEVHIHSEAFYMRIVRRRQWKVCYGNWNSIYSFVYPSASLFSLSSRPNWSWDLPVQLLKLNKAIYMHLCSWCCILSLGNYWLGLGAPISLSVVCVLTRAIVQMKSKLSRTLYLSFFFLFLRRKPLVDTHAFIIVSFFACCTAVNLSQEPGP